MNRLTLPPLSLYIHIPWCLKKCPYCDFNSHTYQGDLPEHDYINQLLADLDSDSDFVQGRELASIFIGGGTPSLFSPGSLARLLDETAGRIPFASNIEITLEANPGTFETRKFRQFRAAGINRLSLGIQSFQQSFLQRLGRVHDDNEALAAAGKAREAGFDNFNLDLMFALPHQSPQQAMADLQTALSLEPAHLSWYQLTIEPNTVFYRRPPELPADDAIATMQDEGIALLADHDLVRYEVSAYARPGRPSRHNLNYWEFGDYLGIGAGAHGKITLPETGSITRTRKIRQPSGYLADGKNLTAGSAPIAVDDLPLEFFMNALRLRDGVQDSLFAPRTGLSLESIEDSLAHLRSKGLLRTDRLATTDTGYRFLNDVLGQFLAGTNPKPDHIPLHSET